MNNTFDYDEYQGYIKAITKLWIRKTSLHLHRQFEDLHHEAVIAFLKCQDKYKPHLPAKPWIKTSIFNHLNDWIRSEVRFNKLRRDLRDNPQSLEDVVDITLSYEQSDRVNVSRYRNSEEESVYDDTIKSLVEGCESLSDTEVLVINTYLDNDGSCAKAGVVLGMNRKRVWRHINRIVTKLQIHTGMAK